MAQKASHFMAALASIACICLFPILSAAAEETVNADAAADQTGWIRTDEKITYRYADGHTASGETEIDGIYYLFSYSGALKTDWQTVNGKRCYYDPATGEAKFGWVDYFGSLYYVSQELGKLTGTQEIEGVTYTFDEDGVLQEMIMTEPLTEAMTEAPTEVPETQASAETTVPETAASAAPAETAAPETTGPIIKAIRSILPAVTEMTAVQAEETSPAADAAAKLAEIPVMIEAEPAAEAAGSPLETLPAGLPEAESISTTFPPLEDLPELIAEVLPIEEIFPEAPADAPAALPEAASDQNPAPTATKSAFELSVPDYLQKDPSWVNASLGGETIGKYGCLVTAMAMLHSYTAGVCTPVDMTAMLTFTQDGSLKRWDDITALGYTVESYSTPVTTEILEAIYQHLCEGKPVVLGSVGSWQHYVIVTGYTGDGTQLTAEDLLIHDPGYPDRTTLAQHLARFGTLYKLIYAT